MNKIEIKPFEKEYQERCKNIILKGLEEHWGWLDETLNSDLNDIENSYIDDIFLTAWDGNNLIATGAAKIGNNGTAEIVRMSVLKEYRSKKIGQQLLHALTNEIYKSGATKVTLETTTKWERVVNFYLNNGFSITKVEGEDTFFERLLWQS